MSLADFHFIRPAWLLALLPWLVLLWYRHRQRRRGGAWAAVCDPALRPYVLSGGGGGRDWLPGLLGAVAAVLIVALAGPTWERRPTPVFRAPSAVSEKSCTPEVLRSKRWTGPGRKLKLSFHHPWSAATERTISSRAPAP